MYFRISALPSEADIARFLRRYWPSLMTEQNREFVLGSEMVVNLNTAKTLGLAVPNSVQLLADEVIE